MEKGGEEEKFRTRDEEGKKTMSTTKRKREEDEGDDDAATRARKMAAMLSQGIGIATPALGTGSNAPASGQSGIGGGGTTRTVKIRVPTESNPGFNYMGLLLGPRGETLKRMESESGARLQIRGRETLRAGQQPKGPEDEEPLHVTITASSDQQGDIATRLVNELLYDDKKAMAIKQAQLEEIALVKSGGAAAPGAALRTGLEHQQGIPPVGGATAAAGGAHGAPGGAANSFAEGDNTIVMIPTNYAGIIIGRGGENIRAIQQDTGSRIQVQRTDEVRPGEKRRITITGEESARAMAKSIVEKMVYDRELEEAQGGGARTRGPTGDGSGISVAIPHAHVGLIIGRGGGTIKGIQGRTGCNVQIPQEADPGSNPPVRTATITGTPEGMAAAKMEVRVCSVRANRSRRCACSAQIALSTPFVVAGGALAHSHAFAAPSPLAHARTHAAGLPRLPVHVCRLCTSLAGARTAAVAAAAAAVRGRRCKCQTIRWVRSSGGKARVSTRSSSGRGVGCRFRASAHLARCRRRGPCR